MPDYYFDTSALVKLYIRENGSARLRQTLGQSEDNRIYILEITRLETRSVFRRLERESKISTTDAERFISQIDQHGRTRYFVEQLSEQVTTEASKLIDKYPLRSLDALQLAGCVLLSQAYHPPPIFVCADYDLCAAAAAERTPTLNPLQPT